MTCGAVIPGAGNASRLGDPDKILIEIAGQPALQRVVDALTRARLVNEFVIVASTRTRGAVNDLVESVDCEKPWHVITGGPTRRESVELGVNVLADRHELVVIHDAARPLVSAQLFDDVIFTANDYGAAITCVPVSDTIKQVDDGVVAGSLVRDSIVAVQTPQAFRTDWLRQAYARYDGSFEATDEAMLIEAAGFPVQLVAGDPANLKITTRVDLLLAEAILKDRRTVD